MPTLLTLTLVWLGAQSPDPAQAATLEAWARAHDATLEEPRVEPLPDAAVAASLVEKLESWLAQARDATQAGDDEAARDVLVRLEQALRQHPELLQASWLMAERYRREAGIARHASPEEALRFERLAQIIEGQRASAFGEPESAPLGVAPIRVELAVHGARRHEIFWDGLLANDAISSAPGEHHLLVFRGARVAWAGWVSAFAPGKIDVWVPDAPPCSAEDLEGVRLEDRTRARAPAGVRCGAWIAAAPTDRPGALSIAHCTADHCEPFARFGDAQAAAPMADERPAASGFLPAWATWALAGVGVAAATSIVLWRAGAFDTATRPKVIYDGTKL